MAGWREWAGLPLLGVPLIKAKLDTGARTSALHATEIVAEEREGRVTFTLAPLPGVSPFQREITLPLLEFREVKDSGGHIENRPVVETEIELGGIRWIAEMTLTSRVSMRFPLLIGRSALRHRFAIDSALAYHLGKRSLESARKFYEGMS